MQLELKALQRRLGITFVFVTHDQGEALSMADRVAIFNHGRIEQLASPRELYTRPDTVFVARFVGGANVVDGELASRLTGSSQPFAVRAEHVQLAPAGRPAPDNAMVCAGVVLDVLYHGAGNRAQVQLAEGTVFTVAIGDPAPPEFSIGAGVRLTWLRAHAVPLRTSPATP
jgi:putative spermidine/putrescine transport system ATP-binding protein